MIFAGFSDCWVNQFLTDLTSSATLPALHCRLFILLFNKLATFKIANGELEMGVAFQDTDWFSVQTASTVWEPAGTVKLSRSHYLLQCLTLHGVGTALVLLGFR